MEGIENGIYVLVTSGDGYTTKIVSGRKLVDEFLTAICGSPENLTKEEHEQWTENLLNPDNWRTDSNYGAITFSEDIGEDGHIEIFRLCGDPMQLIDEIIDAGGPAMALRK